MRFNSARLVLYQIDKTQRSARAQIVENLPFIIFFSGDEDIVVKITRRVNNSG